jgi:hypothetical protein
MTRVLLLLLALGAFGSLCSARANATTEFCPAVLDYAPVQSAQIYGVQLRALSGRQIIARMAFDTSAGWFQADVPQTTLSASIRTIPLKYPVDIGLATSPIMYVRFPQKLHINHAFVTSALSYGDVFGWSDRGQVTCPIAPEAWPDPKYSLADVSGLSAPPPHDAQILPATSRPPLESSTCT